jgi:hypothetical protein
MAVPSKTGDRGTVHQGRQGLARGNALEEVSSVKITKRPELYSLQPLVACSCWWVCSALLSGWERHFMLRGEVPLARARAPNRPFHLAVSIIIAQQQPIGGGG